MARSVCSSVRPNSSGKLSGRADEGGEGIGVSDDALLPQGVGHGAGDALLGVRHRAVQIEKYRIPAHQPANSFTQRR